MRGVQKKWQFLRNIKFKEAANFLLAHKRKVIAICLAIVVCGSAGLFFISKFKSNRDSNQPTGLIGEYKKQLPQLEKKAKSGDPKDLQQYGIALYAVGDLAKAEETYRAQIKVDDRNPMAHNNLANTLRDQKKFEQAIEEYRRAVELAPQNENSYLNLASVYQYSLKDFDKALEVYQNAMEANPENVDFMNMAAMAYEQKGDEDNARQYFEKVLAKQADNQVAKAGLERLKK